MFQPVRQIEVGRAFKVVSPDASFVLKFDQPSLNQVGNVVIIWVEKAREHSRGRASAAGIVDDRDEVDEQEPSFAADTPDRFRLAKFRLDRADSGHYFGNPFLLTAGARIRSESCFATAMVCAMACA